MLKKLTEDYIAYFTGKNLSGIEMLLADRFVLEDPVVKRIEDKEEALHAIQKIFDSCQTLSFQANNIYQDGNTTLIEFILKLDNTILSGVDIIEWHNGKMQQLRAYLDIPK
jgi:hypothetical protein